MAYEAKYTLRVLIDDWVEETPWELEGEHGLSFYVETPESKFLFDCGHTGAAWRNAEKMGVDLSAVDFVALSHSHYDHAGGFPALLAHVKPKVLYTGPDFWQEKYSYDREKDEYLYKGCGFTADDLAAWGIEQRECQDMIRLDNHATLFTGFARTTDFEHIPEKFVRGAAKEPDSFTDEICLLLEEGNGLCMVVGCSHRGIVNMVAAVKARTGKQVLRVVGGIHLAGASEACVSQTVKELKNLGVAYFNLCHCSLDACHSSGVWPMYLDTFAAGSAICSGQEEGVPLLAAILYDSRTHTTEKAAAFIAEGVQRAGLQPACFHIDEADAEYIEKADLIILGSPTYMASVTAKMKTWLEEKGSKLDLAYKVGGAFATEQYIHGGGENAIREMLTFMMVQGMMTYSGGKAYGKPIIHLGPVGMSQDIGSFRDLFVAYGERMGKLAAWLA